jgi:hypothetical protein
MVRRDAFLASGGFREDLYPNEENEWLNRMADQGWRFRYHPGAWVRRPRRPDVPAFAKQAFRYGRGRLRQTFVNPHPGDLLHALPAGFVLYLAALPLLERLNPLWGLPFILYTFACLTAAFHALVASAEPGIALLCLLLYPVRQLGYGVGWLWGLVRGGRVPGVVAPQPRLERIALKAWRRG